MTRRGSIGDYFARRSRIVNISVRYSRFVALMRVALPISAAALAVLVLAWPYLTGKDEGFHLTVTDVGIDTAEGVQMTNVRFFNSDGKGQPISVTAESVSQDQDDPDIVRFVLPAADIELEGGTWVALTAQRGAFHRTDQTLLLEGAVNLFSDEGYELRTERVEFDLRAKSARGDAAVEGQGPLGLLSAARFRFDNASGSIHFEGHVRMVIYPKAGV